MKDLSQTDSAPIAPLTENRAKVRAVKINSILGSLKFEGDFSSLKECVLAAIKSGANLCNANLCGANLCGADLCGADLCGERIKSIRAFGGLYRYQVFAILSTDGKRFVKMGCLFKSLEEWSEIGILESNINEFPNDGSRKSLERKEAFEFARNAAINLTNK